MFLTLLWVHVVFVFPYVMLSLGPSWRRFDTSFTDLAANLGAGPWRRFCAVKLPILLIPVLTAFAVGFAVSQALYLPTVFASNGRIATLTTEAVILASGASRRQDGTAARCFSGGGFGSRFLVLFYRWHCRTCCFSVGVCLMILSHCPSACTCVTFI